MGDATIGDFPVCDGRDSGGGVGVFFGCAVVGVLFAVIEADDAAEPAKGGFARGATVTVLTLLIEVCAPATEE